MKSQIVIFYLVINPNTHVVFYLVINLNTHKLEKLLHLTDRQQLLFLKYILKPLVFWSFQGV